ncbi:MAG: hypothetical protein ACO3YA_05350 [Candidatus Nanopelagicaceae bacterium]
MLTKRGKIVIGVLVAVVLFFAFGLRITHPQSGLDHALGSAQSSVALYRVTDTFSMDDRVIAALPTDGPALGVVRGEFGDAYDVQIGSQLFRLNKQDIDGKMLVIIPFIGSLLGLFGL